MKLDYEIKIDKEELKLTLLINEQDERFWKKEVDNNLHSFKYECKNGFIIRSNHSVTLFFNNRVNLKGYETCDSCVKGYETCDSCDSIYFNTLEELNEYKEKLVEALEEFKTYEPTQITESNELNSGIIANNKLSVTFNAVEEKFIPQQSTEFAQGYDIFVNRIIVDGVEIKSGYYSLSPYESVKIGTGFNAIFDLSSIPKGFIPAFDIRSRSGLGFNERIESFHGAIDADYHNEFMICLTNFSKNNRVINIGQKIAQIVPKLVPKLEVKTNIVKDLTELKMNDRIGFGSTGK